MRIRHAIAALAIATLSAGFATACGDDDDDSGASSGGGNGSATTTGGGAKVDPSKPQVRLSLVSIKIPGSDLLTPYTAGAQAAADQINAEGGFGGRKLVLDTCNSLLAPPTNVTCARKTIAEKPLAMIGCDPNWGSSGFPIYEKAGVPSIWCLATPQDFANKLAFGLDLGGYGQQGGIARWLCSQPDIKRVVNTLLDVPQLRAEYPKAVNPVLKGCGKEVKTVFVPITAADYTPVLNQVLDFKPDWVMVYALTGPQTVQIYKAYEQAGYPADQTSTTSSSFDVDTMLKPAGSAVDGVRSLLPVANPQDTSNPDVARYREAIEAAGEKPDNPNVATGYVYVNAVYAAAKEIGFDKLTSASLAEYLNSQNGIHLPMSRQLVNPGPQGFAQVKQPYGQLVQWTGGKLVTVVDGTEDGWISGYSDAPGS